MTPFNPDHPDFDSALELLCMLPLPPIKKRKSEWVREPVSIPGKYLAADLRLTGPRCLGSLVRRLKEEFEVKVLCHNLGGTRAYGFHKYTTMRAKVLGEAYWSKVYGPKSSTNGIMAENFEHRHERLK